ncbi:hypothetical protein H7X65_03250 [Candidatus Parcubacteria bacterium]|nr:hypothetical protein [Candidatus Parcubacteria bacterium]
MSTENITFENDNNFKYKSRVVFGQAEVPGMVRFLMRKGIVKNEKTAQTFMVGAIIAFFVSSLIVFAIFVFDVRLPGSAPKEDPEAAMQRETTNERRQQMRNNQINNTANTTQ